MLQVALPAPAGSSGAQAKGGTLVEMSTHLDDHASVPFELLSKRVQEPSYRGCPYEYRQSSDENGDCRLEIDSRPVSITAQRSKRLTGTTDSLYDPFCEDVARGDLANARILTSGSFSHDRGGLGFLL